MDVLTQYAVQGDTEEARAGGASKPNSEAYDEDSLRANDEVQNEVEPPLAAVQQVVRSLRVVQQPLVLGLEPRLPSKRANGRKTTDGFQKVGIQRTLAFEVQQTQLSRGAKVYVLERPDGEDEERDAYNHVDGTGRDQSRRRE